MDLYKSVDWAHSMHRTERHYFELSSELSVCLSISLSHTYTLCIAFSVFLSVSIWLSRLWSVVCFRTVISTWYQSARVRTSSVADKSFRAQRQGGYSLSWLTTEKLERNNYTSWSYKMHQYMLGHEYWSDLEGANDVAPDSTHRDFPAWE